MKTTQQNNSKGLTSKQRVELYFSKIIERQKLEELYYATGDKELLPEIQKARERIRDAMKGIGIQL